MPSSYSNFHAVQVTYFKFRTTRNSGMIVFTLLHLVRGDLGTDVAWEINYKRVMISLSTKRTYLLFYLSRWYNRIEVKIFPLPKKN